MRAVRLLAIVASALGACGGAATDPLLGVWQVGAHTRNDGGCEAEGPALAGPPFVQFQLSPVEGQEVFELVDCAAPTACEPSRGLAGRLYTEDLLGGGVRAEVYTAFGDTTACALAAQRSQAVISVDGGLRVETRSFELRDVSGVVCDGASAERMFTSLPCLRYEVLTATRP